MDKQILIPNNIISYSAVFLLATTILSNIKVLLLGGFLPIRATNRVSTERTCMQVRLAQGHHACKMQLKTII